MFFFFFFSSRRRHTRSYGDWSSDVCSSDLHGQLAVEGIEAGRQVAAVTQPGGDPQGAPFPGAADDDRHWPGRARVAGRLRQRYPLAAVRLGARLPEGTHRLDRQLQLVEPLGGGGERQPERGVLTIPPA